MGNTAGYGLILPNFQIILTENGVATTPLCTTSGFARDLTLDLVSPAIPLAAGASTPVNIELTDAARAEVVTLPTPLTRDEPRPASIDTGSHDSVSPSRD